MAALMQPFHQDLQREGPNHPITARAHTHTQMQQKHLEATDPLCQKNINPQARKRRTHTHTRYLSSPAGAAVPEKTRDPTTSQNKTGATSIQPLQFVLHPHVAHSHLSTQMATQHGNIHQPFHCDLQPMIPNRPKTTQTHKRSQSSSKPQFRCGKKKTSKRKVATAAHTRYLSSPAGAAVPEKTQGFVTQLPPKTKRVQHPPLIAVHSGYVM